MFALNIVLSSSSFHSPDCCKRKKQIRYYIGLARIFLFIFLLIAKNRLIIPILKNHSGRLFPNHYSWCVCISIGQLRHESCRMIDASATRSRETLITLKQWQEFMIRIFLNRQFHNQQSKTNHKQESTTAIGSSLLPILHVEA